MSQHQHETWLFLLPIIREDHAYYSTPGGRAQYPDGKVLPCIDHRRMQTWSDYVRNVQKAHIVSLAGIELEPNLLSRRPNNTEMGRKLVGPDNSEREVTPVLVYLKGDMSAAIVDATKRIYEGHEVWASQISEAAFKW